MATAENDEIELAPLVAPPVAPLATPSMQPVRFPPVAVQPQRFAPHLPLRADDWPPGVASREPRITRAIFSLVAWAIFAGYLFFVFRFFAPAPCRPGIDENAYLLAGRNLVEHGTGGFKPADDYEFVGAMFVRTNDAVFEGPRWLPSFVRDRLRVRTEAGWYYPKYPIGSSVLYGLAMKLMGGTHSLAAAERSLFVSPASAALAVLGMFYLGRAVVGSSYFGVLAMIALGFVPTMLQLEQIPGSHAPALFWVVWGMYFLVRWWGKRGAEPRGYARLAWGILAGFFLGTAVTMRYTEALLLFPLYPLDQVLSDTAIKTNHPWAWHVVRAVRLLPIGPLGLAAMSVIRLRWPRTWLTAIVPVLAWCVPVGALVAYNWFTLGHATGYDTTHESTGFTTREFLEKWSFSVFQVYVFGLFLLAPLGVAGIAVAFRWSKRAGYLLMMWFVPGALLYTSYYWGDSMPGVGYLRFFLTLLPPLILGALWLIRSATVGAVAGERQMGWWRRGSIAGQVIAGLLVAFNSAIGLAGSLPTLERQFRANANLVYSVRAIARVGDFSSPPVILVDEGVFPQLLMDGQFMLDGNWYCTDIFEIKAGGGFGVFAAMQTTDKSPDAPLLIQKDRIEYATGMRKGKTTEDFKNDFAKMVNAALDSGRKVYAVLTPPQAINFPKRLAAGRFEMKQVAKWREPVSLADIETAESPLVPKEMTGEPMIRWQPTTETMYELRKLPMAPSTRATTGPTTR